MSFNNIKIAPLFLSASIVGLSAIAYSPNARAAQLNLNSPVDSVEGADFAVPFDSTLQESGLIETSSQESSIPGFTCEIAPEGSQGEVRPDSEILSHLGPNLVAQAGLPFDIGQSSELGPIIGENCELDGSVGGVGSAFNPAFLSPLLGLGALGFLAGGDGDGAATPDVPEPIAIPFIFSALGIGAVAARKRFKSSDSE